MAEYLNLIAGGDQARKVGLRSPVYPAVERALKMCTGYFEKHVLASSEEGGQDILASVESQKKLLAVIGDTKFEDSMLDSWKGDGATTRERWAELCKELSRENKRRWGRHTARREEMKCATTRNANLEESQLLLLLRTIFQCKRKLSVLEEFCVALV